MGQFNLSVYYSNIVTSEGLRFGLAFCAQGTLFLNHDRADGNLLKASLVWTMQEIANTSPEIVSTTAHFHFRELIDFSEIYNR
jgi:hypothetical protein